MATEPSTQDIVLDEWEGIRYVLYVTVGWLVATVVAVALLMLVVPALF